MKADPGPKGCLHAVHFDRSAAEGEDADDDGDDDDEAGEL